MHRRWPAVVLVLLAAVALGCEQGARGGSPPAPASTNLPSSIAALGDSISAGYASCLALVACHLNSWSTGTSLRVDSHYRRIQRDNPGIRGRAHTLAAPGARAGQLAGQARAAVRAGVQYVTILVGANDACRGAVGDMTAPATFRDQIADALAVLREGLPRARVLVVAVPDLYRLWEIGHTDTRAVRAWSLGVCPALLARPTSSAAADVARRRSVRDRVVAYNRELRAACSGYGSRCRYAGASHQLRFSLAMVNRLDYFHPSAAGQDRLAEVTWSRRLRR